jgi:hypothetical protein
MSWELVSPQYAQDVRDEKLAASTRHLSQMARSAEVQTP